MHSKAALTTARLCFWKQPPTPTISIQKPFCENENKIVNIYGERLRAQSDQKSAQVPCAESGAMDDLMKGARGLGEGSANILNIFIVIL